MHYQHRLVYLRILYLYLYANIPYYIMYNIYVNKKCARCHMQESINRKFVSNFTLDIFVHASVLIQNLKFFK